MEVGPEIAGVGGLMREIVEKRQQEWWCQSSRTTAE
jgi:hypothetical protein